MTGKLAKERAKAQRARRNENRAIEREAELRNRLKLVSVQRDELLAFVEEVRRSGDTRLASMAIAVLAIAKEIKHEH